jgi:uncharacterized surface protein with fasciclin (FAS1) repeats
MAGSQVVISEMMVNPVVISDVDGEWVELFNQSDDPVDLTGWKIDGAVITGTNLIIQPMDFFVVCRNSNQTENGGVTCDATANFSLTNDGKDLVLTDEAAYEVDTVEYDSSDVSAGESTVINQKKNGQTELGSESTSVYGDTENTGTPGAANLATENIEPIFECYIKHLDGTHTAFFGYENYNGVPVEVPYGDNNQVNPATYQAHFPEYFDSIDGPTAGFPDAPIMIENWDGSDIEWELTDQGTARADLNGPLCAEQVTTLLDQVADTPELQTLEEAALDIVSDCLAVDALDGNPFVELTVFAPINSAFAALPSAELAALLDHPDELCELISYHAHAGNIIRSTDVTGPVTIPTVSGDQLSSQVGDDSLSVTRSVSGDIIVDGYARVAIADVTAFNGIVHAIDAVLLPENPLVTIDPIETTSASPELTGTWDNTAYVGQCLSVRIDGVLYAATLQDDGTWVIPAGVVMDNSLTPNTLFTLVLRDDCADDVQEISFPEYSIERSRVDLRSSDLLALTMQRSIVSQPDETSAGEVLGETTTRDVESPTPKQTQVLASTTCGKAVCETGSTGGSTLSPEEDTNNNGIPDAEEDLNGNGIPDGEETADGGLSDNDGVTTDEADGESDWYWWFIGAGTAAMVWYVFWRRQDT